MTTVPKLERIPVKSVLVANDRKRRVNRTSVAKLSESIRALGLRTPITVEPKDRNGKYRLVAGATRLAVFALHKEETIPAYVWKCTEVQAEAWEIAENLHRTELTLSQRDAGITRFAELMSGVMDEERVAEAVGETPTDTEKARRRQRMRDDDEIATLAKQYGVDNVKSVMDEVAAAPTRDEAIEILHNSHRARQHQKKAKAEAEKKAIWHKWRIEIENLWKMAPSDEDRDWFLTNVVPGSKPINKAKKAA